MTKIARVVALTIAAVIVIAGIIINSAYLARLAKQGKIHLQTYYFTKI
jgi:hypothetical protein